MLDLAIAIDTDARNRTIIETNGGMEMKAPDWPHDCEFQLVGFGPSARTCEIVYPAYLVGDIGEAIRALDRAGVFKKRKPGWYRRLERYAREDDPRSE
jgi:hypothetical protein